tara:strand:- start:25332 stop:25934 length:603 start_codon:yes stop_codon:yes gene_type:complete
VSNTGAVVTEIQDMLLAEEADYLVKNAPTPVRSSVMGKDGKSEFSRVRTSSTAHMPRGSDPVISCIENRIATISGQPGTHLEPLQVTDYKHKQKYDPHHDYFGNKTAQSGRGERTTTVFAYLKDDMLAHGSCGGATAFPKLRDLGGEPLRVFPKKGNAVMWSNRTLDGKVNARTLHGGEAITCPQAHKIGLNAWFRDQPW